MISFRGWVYIAILSYTIWFWYTLFMVSWFIPIITSFLLGAVLTLIFKLTD